MPKRTTKQSWAFERAFFNKGSLVSIRSRLQNILWSDSTLLDERSKLLAAVDLIDIVLDSWDGPKRKDVSQKLFNERQEKMKP